MCGRTACTLESDDIVKACTYKDESGKRKRPRWKEAPGGQKYRPSYNIAPTSHTPVLMSSNFEGIKSEFPSERIVTPMKWGLTPSWHKGDPYKVPYETNNCRAEGMLEKKTYKVPLQKGHRCVVLADGYFEWKTTAEGKQPYFFYLPQPSGITYPGETAKTEILSDINDEKMNSKETFLDKALKQELSSQEIKQEKIKKETSDNKKETNKNLQKSNTPIKQECPSDVSPSQTHNLSQPVNNNDRSFWDSLKTEMSEVESDSVIGESQQAKSLDVRESQHSAVKLKQTADGDSASDEICEWMGQRLLTMAGVYDVWNPPDGSPPLYSYSVITVPASPELEWCHNRMPAILSTDEEVQKWLDSANIPLQEAASLIKPHNCLKYHPVSKAVNNSRYKTPDCIKPVELGKPKVCPSSKMMKNWLKSGSPAKKKKAE